VPNAGLPRPRVVSLDFGLLAHRERSVLVPAERPIGRRRLIEKERTDRKRPISENGYGEPRQIPDDRSDLDAVEEIARRVDLSRPPNDARRIVFERLLDSRQEWLGDQVRMDRSPVRFELVEPAQVRRRPTCAWTNASTSGNRNIGFVAFSSLIVETGRSE